MIVLSALFIFLATAVMGKNIITDSKPDFSAKIRSEISYPQFALDQNIQGSVLISFAFDNAGNVHVDEVNASNNDLRNYVVQKISNMKPTKADGVFGKSYNMRFVFRLE